MILDNITTTIAYRCPICGQGILSGVNLFRLKGDVNRLRCPECDTVLSVSETNEGKLRISVPCMICPNPHNLTIAKNAFFEKDLFTLPCPLSGIDTLFVGKEEKVREALDESGRQLSQILEEEGVDSFAPLHAEEEEKVDPAVDSVVRFLLCELEDEKKITCYCNETGEIPLYDFQVLSERVRIFCHCCNAEAYLPLRSEADAEDFIKTDSLRLK